MWNKYWAVCWRSRPLPYVWIALVREAILNHIRILNKLSCRALIALALIASTSLLLPQRSQACGPFFTDAIFVYTKHPDFPLERFARGQLGVLRPTYARSYLFAAYRNLPNAPFTDTEPPAL